MRPRFIKGTLLLCSALLFNPAQAEQVNGWTITVPNAPQAGSECDWDGAATSLSTPQIAVSNGVIYGVLDGANSTTGSSGIVWYNTFYYNTSDPTGATTAWGVINTGSTNNGLGIAADSRKNIVFAYGTNPGATTQITKMRVYKAASSQGEVVDPTQYKDLDFSKVFTAITNFTNTFSASGNLWDGTGYLYFTNGSVVVRITVTHNSDGTISYKQTTVDIPSSLASTVRPNDDYIKPLPNGLYMLMLRSNASTTTSPTVTLDCTIDWSNLKFTAGATTTSYYQSSAMGYLKGHEIYAHPGASRNTATGNSGHHPITVAIDRTRSTSITSHYYWTSGVGAIGTINAWCEFEQVDDNTLGLYMLSPRNTGNSHVSRYDITADEISTIKGEIIKSPSGYPNRQNAVVTWDAMSEATTYRVDYYTTYSTPTADYISNWATIASSTTDLSASIENIYSAQVSDYYYPRTYHIRVTPLTASGAPTGTAKSVTLTPELLSVAPTWRVLDGVEAWSENYEGYQKLQLFWERPISGPRPDYYNVYRDGVKINTDKIINLNFLDTEIPTGEHTYTIEACHNNYPSLSINSEPRTVTIAPRNPMKTTYSIETIYNYPIGIEDGNVKPQGIYANLTNRVRYKQGVYYKGDWYVAQQYDNNAQDGTTAAGTAYGGVMKFSADKNKILSETATRVIGYDISSSYSTLSLKGYNVGVAADEGGNIFVRRGGSTGVNGNMTSTARKSFCFELGYGYIYLRNADGTYDSESPITVDLSKCQISDNYGSDPWHGLYFGRTDYYNLSGDLSEVGGTAYLWISGSATYRSNKILLTRTGTSTISATLVEKVDIPTSMINTGDTNTGVENYVFPVRYLKKNADGTFSHEYRRDYIHQLRSRVYADIKPTNNATDATDTLSVVYNTLSRVNNAGGCTIGWNGEIFLITPQCTYSQNSGNFLVSMGDRTDYSATRNTGSENGMLDNVYADLSNPIPAAQLTQDEITDGSYNDANGNWLYAVHGKIENEEEIGITEGFTDPGEATCVYIYQYIPGVRFAKYRLVPNNYFPGTPVDLTINNMHEDTEYTDGDLVRYDGKAQFGIALETSVTTTGNVNYEIDDYTYTFKDAAGTDVWTYTVSPDGSYTYTRVKDGETTTGSGTGALVNESYTDINGDVHSAYFTFEHSDLKRDTNYQSTVTVNYVNTVDDTDKHQSETTVDEDKRNYTPEPPVKENVTVFKGEDDSSVDGIYRVEVNFDQPATTPEEPVSYYEVIVTKPVVDANGNQIKDAEGNLVTVTDTITGFDLMVGGVPENTGKDYVPGNYDFDSNEGQYAEGGTSTVIFYYTVPETTPDDNASTDPMDWTYTVSAVYGGSNPNISAEASVDMSPSNGGTTAIENIGNSNGKLNVYPVPAQTVITVKAAEAIETVTLYSLTGTAVMEFAGNSDTTMTVDISALASGYYFLEVNRNPVVRVLKK